MIKRGHVLLIILVLIFLAIIAVQKNKQQEPGKVSAQGRLVDGFPELPVLPNSTVEKSYKKEDGVRIGYEADYLINTPPKEAMIWYKLEFQKLGWLIYNEQIEGIESEFAFTAKKGDQIVNVFAESEDGKTEISLEIPLQQKL